MKIGAIVLFACLLCLNALCLPNSIPSPASVLLCCHSFLLVFWLLFRSWNLQFTIFLFFWSPKNVLLAKASFSAHLLGKSLLLTGEKVPFFSDKIARPMSVVFFCNPLSPVFASIWPNNAVFAFHHASHREPSAWNVSSEGCH